MVLKDAHIRNPYLFASWFGMAVLSSSRFQGAGKIGLKKWKMI